MGDGHQSDDHFRAENERLRKELELERHENTMLRLDNSNLRTVLRTLGRFAESSDEDEAEAPPFGVGGG